MNHFNSKLNPVLWRRGFILTLIILLTVTTFFVLRGGSEFKPIFIPVSSLTNCDQLTFVSYRFLTERPFEGGKMWIQARGPDGFGNYLFDLEKHTILGRLRYADPAFLTKDGEQVVCSIKVKQFSLKQAVRNLFSRQSKARAYHGPSKDNLWLVNLDDNSDLLPERWTWEK